MKFASELAFFQGMARQLRLSASVMTLEPDSLDQLDGGLRRRLGVADKTVEHLRDNLRGFLRPNAIFRIIDEFSCRYALMLIPETQGQRVLVVGPYVTEDIDRNWLEFFVERNAIHQEWLPVLEQYFRNVTFLQNERALNAGLATLAEYFWGAQQFQTESIVTGVPEVWIPLGTQPDQTGREDVVADIQNLEMRYESENRLMQAVSQGRSHTAEQMLSNFSQLALEQRTAEPGRNIKNYSIILNTILRKAVEQGGVHPLYIDRLSSEFAYRIERLGVWDDVTALWRDMAHKYCLLVEKHSIKKYSPMIQKVIARVDYDLAADLSLKGNAAALNVNASYLSSMFKNEIGTTLTDYVNRKRMEHAIFLLNTTKLSISAIGQRCGIQDDNYFTKIFKKYTGKTPKQFRQENIHYPRNSP